MLPMEQSRPSEQSFTVSCIPITVVSEGNTAGVKQLMMGFISEVNIYVR